MSADARLERYLELLAAQALGDLGGDEATELTALAKEFPEIDAEEFDRVSAALCLALSPCRDEEMPSELRAQIQRDAAGYVTQVPVTQVQNTDNQTFVEPRRQHGEMQSVSRREMIAWLVTAASLLVAVIGWITQPQPVGKPSLAKLRADLLLAPDLVQSEWQAGKHPFDTDVQGEVIWSSDKQEGYMRFVGMPVNDPSQEQYQLWIIDPARDDEPIDGGVFDVTDDGEVIVPIRAKLGVLAPQAFAITIEKPGGVVVSTQESLPLLAPVP